MGQPLHSVPHDIAFLHTSPVHIPTFEALMQEVAPALRIGHVVREDLLIEAQRDGLEDPSVIAHIHQAMTDTSATGALVVVCTCSTLGGIAETIETGGSFTPARIDRAMADRAVSQGCPVLIVATQESTIAPTTALLQSSAERHGITCLIQRLVVPDAWTHFITGDNDRYIEVIVRAVRQAATPSSIVVLAQASMAAAAPALASAGITALSSPRLGVEYAVGLHARLRSNVC